MSVQLLQKKFLPDNKSESSEKVPDKICVEMTPKTNAAWSFVQELATNPRVRMLLKGDRKLSSVMNYMSSKWKPHRVKLVSSLCDCLVIEILTCGWYEILIGIIWGGGIKIWEFDCIWCGSCIAEIQGVEHLIIKYTQFKVWQQPFSLTSFRKRVWMGRMTWTLYWWCIPTVTVRLHPCHFIQSRRLKSTWHSITTKRIPRVSSLPHIRPLLKEHFLTWYSVHLTKWLVLVLL